MVSFKLPTYEYLAYRIPKYLTVFDFSFHEPVGVGHHSPLYPFTDTITIFTRCPEITQIISCFQFSRSVMSDSLQPHEPQHARPACPSPTPWAHPNPCPSSWSCHPTISSSVVLFSSCLQSFPASGSSQMSQLFASGGQGIGVSASTSVLSTNTQDWSPLGWTG